MNLESMPSSCPDPAGVSEIYEALLQRRRAHSIFANAVDFKTGSALSALLGVRITPWPSISPRFETRLGRIASASYKLRGLPLSLEPLDSSFGYQASPIMAHVGSPSSCRSCAPLFSATPEPCIYLCGWLRLD